MTQTFSPKLNYHLTKAIKCHPWLLYFKTLNTGLCATFLGAVLRNLMGNFKNDIILILFS